MASLGDLLASFIAVIAIIIVLIVIILFHCRLSSGAASAWQGLFYLCNCAYQFAIRKAKNKKWKTISFPRVVLQLRFSSFYIGENIYPEQQ